MERIVILVTPQEKAAFKKKVGLVSLSAYLRSVIQQLIKDKKGN
jgi:hypothetical protein